MTTDFATDRCAALRYCTPGDPTGIRVKADQFGEIAQDARVAHRDLSVLVDRDLCDIWEGQLATSFTEMVDGEVLEAIGKLHRSFERAGSSLTTYARRLEEMQEKVEAAVDRAVGASEAERTHSDAANHASLELDRFARVERLHRANLRSLEREFQASLSIRQPDDIDYDRRLRDWNDRWHAEHHALNMARNDGARAGSRVRRHEGEAHEARERLASAVRWMEDVKAERVAAENQTAAELEDAGRLGVQNRNLLEKGWDWITDLENLDKLLENIASACGVLAILVNIVPGVGQALSAVLMTVVLVAAVMGTLVTAARWAKGDVSGWTALGDVAFCAIDLFTAGTGSSLAKSTRGLPELGPLWKRVGSRIPGWERVPPVSGLAGDVVDSVRVSRQSGQNVFTAIPKAFSRDEFLYTKIHSVGAEYANSKGRAIVDSGIEISLELVDERARGIIPQVDVLGILGGRDSTPQVSGVPRSVLESDAVVTRRELLDPESLDDHWLDRSGASQ